MLRDFGIVVSGISGFSTQGGGFNLSILDNVYIGNDGTPAGTVGMTLSNTDEASKIYWGGYFNHINDCLIRGFGTGILLKNQANDNRITGGAIYDNNVGIELQRSTLTEISTSIETALPNAIGILIGTGAGVAGVNIHDSRLELSGAGAVGVKFSTNASLINEISYHGNHNISRIKFSGLDNPNLGKTIFIDVK